MTYPEDEAGERNQGTKFKEVADMIFIPLLSVFLIVFLKNEQKNSLRSRRHLQNKHVY